MSLHIMLRPFSMIQVSVIPNNNNNNNNNNNILTNTLIIYRKYTNNILIIYYTSSVSSECPSTGPILNGPYFNPVVTSTT